MIQDIFTAVKDAIIENVPAIKYVSEDWGQLDFYQNHPPVQWPCLLYDVDEFAYTDRANKQQAAEGTITIRVADYKAVNTSALSPDNTPPLAMLELLSGVYKALHGLSRETFSGLKRVGLIRVRSDNGVREYRMTFKTSFLDNDAIKNNTRTRPSVHTSIV